jgi:hypothetical protein
MRSRAAALFALAIALASCGGDRTAILIEVTSSDLFAPDDVDSLRFEVVSDVGARIDQTFPITGAWPHSLTVVPPPAERTSTVRIAVTGTRAGAFVVRRVVQSAFQPGITRRVTVDLPASCRAVECAEGVDCVAGRCAGATEDGGVDGGADAGPDDAGETLDSGPPSDSGPFDAGRDAGPVDAGRDAGAIDAGRDGGPADGGGVIRCVDAACVGRLVISEVASRGATGAADEFVELHNRGSAPLDVTGVELRYFSSGGTEAPRATIGPAVIPPHGYFLLANTGYAGTVAPDAAAPRWSTGLADDGTVAIRTASAVVLDRFGWGTATEFEGSAFTMRIPTGSDSSHERKAQASSTAASMAAGGADATAGNGYDTGANGTDFVLRAARDPQSLASPPEP